MSVIKKPPARAAYATLPRYGRTNTTTRWFTRASGRRALGAMCVARLPHRRTSGRLLRIAAAEDRSWHGWMEAAILLLPMPRAEAELTRRVMGMGLNDLITEKAGRCLGVSELTASLVQRRPRATRVAAETLISREGAKLADANSSSHTLHCLTSLVRPVAAKDARVLGCVVVLAPRRLRLLTSRRAEVIAPLVEPRFHGPKPGLNIVLVGAT